MSVFQVKIKNVSIYPYINWPKGGGIGPVILPVLTGASGTYYFSSFGMGQSQGMELTGGKLHPDAGKILIHSKYIAVGQYEDGQPFRTPTWEYCTEAGPVYRFDREFIPTSELTPSATTGDAVADSTISPIVPAYIITGPLTNIRVSMLGGPVDPIIIPLIEDGTGDLIVTKLGTPHEPGVLVKTGKVVNRFHAGMDRIVITGIDQHGVLRTIGNTTCVAAEMPAIFIKNFRG